MRHRKRLIAGFTLIELMIVVVIVGILATMAYPNYVATRERSLDKEAISGLMLIRNSERMFFSRLDRFWPTPAGFQTSIAFINGNLTLDMNERIWDYSVTSVGTTVFTGRAVRAGRTWSITNTGGDPVCAGACL